MMRFKIPVCDDPLGGYYAQFKYYVNLFWPTLKQDRQPVLNG